MVDRDEIRRALEEVRANTLRLIAEVNEEDLCRPIHPEFSPLGWHLGHIGVTEAYWILQQCKQEPPLSAFYDFFFVPTENPKSNRVHLPAREEILAYLHTEREQVLAFLSSVDFHVHHPLLREGNIFNMLLQHEEQHTETMRIILQLFAAARYQPTERNATGTVASGLLAARRQTAVARTASTEAMVWVPAGPFAMGSNDISCTLDNERPQQIVSTAGFCIDRLPVTNQDFLTFIESGGYRTPHWWTPSGWRWREEHMVEHPLYWRRAGSEEWKEITRDGGRALSVDQPVSGISWYEADAYARFVSKRLPTEVEWEKAARGGYIHDCGRVWEWTSTWFQPYAGFTAHPYEGYSVPYFDGQHRVLSGGSWATQAHVRRATFRNWYQPWVREIFGGVRCVKDGDA